MENLWRWPYLRIRQEPCGGATFHVSSRGMETTKAKVKRRTLQEVAEWHRKSLREIETRQASKLKEQLLELKSKVEAVALLSSGKPFAPKLGQAAQLLGGAAGEIKVEQ